MAIRSGSPGLKYPLPANTIAQQSAAAASAGGSASASAYGANRSYAANKMRVQADLANSAAERDFRARSQMEEQGFRARENFYDREHQAGAQIQGQEFRANQEELDRNFRAYQQQSGQNFQLNRDKAEMDFTRERDQAQFDRGKEGFEREVDAGIEADIRTGKLELPPEAQNELNKIEAGRVEAQKLDPAGQADYERQAQERTRKLIRTARPPKGPTATDAANQGTTFYDPATGKFESQMGPGRTPGRVGKDGQFQPIVDNSAQNEQQQKRREEIEKWARDKIGQPNPAKPGEFFTAEDAAKMVEDYEKNFGGQQPAPAGQQPAPEQPPPVPPPAPQNPLDVPPLPPSARGPVVLPERPGSGLGSTLRPRPGVQVLPEALPGSPGYQPQPGPQTLPQTPGAGAGIAPVPLAGANGLGSQFVPPGQKPVDLNAPPPPGPGPGTAGMGSSVQSRSGSYGEPPQGFPAGSKAIDFNTYLLPDGRIVREKGK